MIFSDGTRQGQKSIMPTTPSDRLSMLIRHTSCLEQVTDLGATKSTVCIELQKKTNPVEQNKAFESQRWHR